MRRFQHFAAVLKARNLEFIRDRSSWSWNVIFPIVLIAGLAAMFSDNRALHKVAVYPAVDESVAFYSTRHIDFNAVEDLEATITKVARHQIDLLLDAEQQRYWVNDSSPSGYLLEQLLRGTELATYQRQPVTGREVRYVDWVVPGVLGVNMMFSCLFGVGYVIVRYRKSGVLKRLKATPLRAIEFLAAQVVSRLWLVVAVTTVVFVGTHQFLDFVMRGSFLLLFMVLVLGAVCLISLGLLVAARTSSEELAGGLLNLLSWPMMVMSGVWFSLEGAHPCIKAAAQILPLTHIVGASRSIMIDGAGLLGIGSSLLYLMLCTALFLTIGAKLFHWE